MDGAFSVYEEDYRAAKEKFDSIIVAASRASGTTAFARHEQDIAAPFDDAKMALQCMEAAARDEGPTMKKQHQATAKQYRAELIDARRRMDDAKRAAERAELMGGSNPGVGGELGSSDKTRLVQAQEHLNQASTALERTKVLVDQTEEIATNTNQTLRDQGNQLRNAHENVRDTTAATTEARGILRQMAWRAVQNKVILILIIIILMAVVGYVAYTKFK